VRRLSIPLLVIIVGLVLLADFVVVSPVLGGLASAAAGALIVIGAGAALAGVAALAVVHLRALAWREGPAAAAIAVLGGMAGILVAGLRPGSEGAADPAVRWLLAALVVPIGATLFGILFVSTLLAARRAVGLRSREATVMVIAAAFVLVVLLPLGGAVGASLAAAAAWMLAIPIGGVFRGLLIGVAVVVAVTAGRTLLGMGPADE
jgi:hypothetical protein